MYIFIIFKLFFLKLCLKKQRCWLYKIDWYSWLSISIHLLYKYEVYLPTSTQTQIFIFIYLFYLSRIYITIHRHTLTFTYDSKFWHLKFIYNNLLNIVFAYFTIIENYYIKKKENINFIKLFVLIISVFVIIINTKWNTMLWEYYTQC